MNYHDLSEEEKQKLRDRGVINGCGSKKWLIKPPDLCFTEVCEEHDFDYWIGGSEVDRWRADQKFAHNMIQVIPKKWYNILIYVYIAFIYTMFVQLFGWMEHFEYGNKKTENDLVILLYGQKRF